MFFTRIKSESMIPKEEGQLLSPLETIFTTLRCPSSINIPFYSSANRATTSSTAAATDSSISGSRHCRLELTRRVGAVGAMIVAKREREYRRGCVGTSFVRAIVVGTQRKYPTSCPDFGGVLGDHLKQSLFGMVLTMGGFGWDRC